MKEGASVLVIGVVDSANIAATQVVVQRGGDGGAAAAEAAGVIAFQQGTPSPDKSVGRIPDYTEGEGTIINGTTAYKAVKAAQAVVPGGISDRVVELSGGEYEVHNISVNWPHHVFVDRNFKVVGWEQTPPPPQGVAGSNPAAPHSTAGRRPSPQDEETAFGVAQATSGRNTPALSR